MNSNKETISRLKFIGKIQIGDKIDLKNMYLQTDGLFTQISRTINQENRNKTLVFLQDTINKAFEILKCYDKSNKNADKIMCINILNDLKSSKSGILNLKETYSFDIKFCCDMDVLLEMIEAKLIELDKLFELNIINEDLDTLSLPPPPQTFFDK
jgi:hypothetical protein